MENGAMGTLSVKVESKEVLAFGSDGAIVTMVDWFLPTNRFEAKRASSVERKEQRGKDGEFEGGTLYSKIEIEEGKVLTPRTFEEDGRVDDGSRNRTAEIVPIHVHPMLCQHVVNRAYQGTQIWLFPPTFITAPVHTPLVVVAAAVEIADSIQQNIVYLYRY